jgi:hypothetical protein
VKAILTNPPAAGRTPHATTNEHDPMKTPKRTQAINTAIRNRRKPEVDELVLDCRNLSAENQKLLTNNILDDLSPVEKARIFILRGEE